MPDEPRHAIIIIIAGLTKMRGNATTGAVVDLITHVNTANDRLVYVEQHPSAATIEDDAIHEILDTVQDFVVDGITTAEDEDNGAVAATIDDLNELFGDIL